ncbi:MAG TPA: AarF/UbiB family protein [Gemmatimonadaceae bacterium]|nr:AarF/UbiB family protein [Gemmatimonadaceae bacterium]
MTSERAHPMAARGGGSASRAHHRGAKPEGEPPESFETYAVTRPPSLIRRFFTTNRHLAGMLSGALVAHVREERRRGDPLTPRAVVRRVGAALVYPFLRRDLRDQPFPVQFRRRLELLGPTYIKLGQILSLREDILPPAITSELRHLLDRLPVVPFEIFRQRIEADVGRPVDEMFVWIDETPLGSASIAQTHRATTREGEDVVIKVVKPWIPETLRRDARLLRGVAFLLQLIIPRYQPQRIINEFTDYTLKEVDLRREADNADTFMANFRDMPDVVFPAVFRQYSGPTVLTMQFLDGVRPDTPKAQALSIADRERLIDLGAAAIIRMLYQDGFFHADLHPGNLIILPGPKVGFIDLGMVGRLDAELRRSLLFYYYSLVTGDAENAARYLATVAEPGPGGDPAGFRREVAEISSRWSRASDFQTFSLAQLVLESLSRGAQFRMYFPVELVLMVKALITFEGVGNVLLPGFDVAAVSKAHIRKVFVNQFSPLKMVQEQLRGAPDFVDALVKVPLLVTEGVRVLEKSTRQRPSNPLAGLRGTLIAGSCLVAGAILVAFHGPWPLWAALFAFAAILTLRKDGS